MVLTCCQGIHANLLKFAPLMHFADQAFIAETTAKMLLEVKAVLFFEDRPFVFTSGWASPVYIDCRKLIFYPRLRGQLVDFAVATLARDVGFEQFDVVAGGEAAGIAYAAWIAERRALVKKGGYLEPAQIGEVEKFLHAPAQWSAAHGGVSAFPSS